jgi:hypothetical protein
MHVGRSEMLTREPNLVILIKDKASTLDKTGRDRYTLTVPNGRHGG